MLSKILTKTAGLERRAMGRYYPRPSSAGPERCIRQMVYHALGTPPSNTSTDRMALVLDDSTWHEELTADWLSKTVYNLHSRQIPIDCGTLDWMPETRMLLKDKVIHEATAFVLLREIKQLKRAGEDATALHVRFTILEANAIKCGYRICADCEGKLIPLHVLHGHADGIIQDLLGSEIHYEHKALNHFSCERIWGGAWPVDYIAQACLYNRGLRKDLPDLRLSSLLIKNKNTAQYMDFTIAYDAETDTAHILEAEHSSEDTQVGEAGAPVASFPNILRNAEQKFAAIEGHRQAGTLPNRPFEMGCQYPCGYCVWEDTCWEGFRREFPDYRKVKSAPKDLDNTIRRYLEVDKQYKGWEVERDALRDKIKKELVALKLSNIATDGYYVSLSLKGKGTMLRINQRKQKAEGA